MQLAIHVQGPPYGSQAASSAMQFALAAIASGHSIRRIFFSNLATLNASALAVPPQDEINLGEQWKTIAEQHQIELVICVSAALRFGMLDQQEAERYSKAQFNVESPFIISGLGQLTEAAIECDRLVTFGA